MLASTWVNYVPARAIDGNRGGWDRLFLIGAIVFNIAIIGYFKYAGLAVRTVNSDLGTGFTVPEVPLPTGISFFTFQTLSYVIDVYRRKVNVQRNVLYLGAYIA